MTDDDSRAAEIDAADAPDVALGDVALGEEIDALLADSRLWEDPSDDLGDRVVVAVRSEAVDQPAPETATRTSWLRPALLGAAAVVAFLFGGVVLFSAVDGPEGTEEFSAELVPTGVIADVDGSIEVTSFDSGLRIDLDAPSLPRRDGRRFYEGWVRTADGMLIPVGTFHDGDDVTLWAGLSPDGMVAFSITLEEAVVPDSVDQRSSGDVVLKVDIGGG